MRRSRSLLPRRRDLPTGNSVRPNYGNALFIIANNIPTLVNRIHVRSAAGDVEHNREPPNPHAQQCGRNELPLVDGLHQQSKQQNPQNGHGNYVRASDVQINLTDERDNPMDTQLQSNDPVPQIRDQNRNGGVEQPQHNEPQRQQQNDGGHRLDDQPIPRQRSAPFVIERLNDDEDGEEHGQVEVAGADQQLPAQNIQQVKLRPAKLYSIPAYLKTHFDFMFYLGISPINGNGEKGSRLQQVAFGFVTALSMLFTFARFKFYFVDRVKSGRLQDYITAWYYGGAILLQIGFIWLVVHRFGRVATVLKDSATDKPGIHHKTRRRNISLLTVTFACFAITVAGMEASKLPHVIAGPLENVEDVLLSHSHSISMLLFLWNKETNGTENYHELYVQYATELNAVTATMGIFGMVMTFVGVLHEVAIRDILLMTSLHTVRLSKIFHSNMVNAFNDNPASDELTSLFRRIHNQLSEMTGDIESCFGNLFKLIHAYYLLYCVYFFVQLIVGEINVVYLLTGSVAVLKIACILYFSTTAIEKSQAVKGVIRKKYCDDDCPNDVNWKKVILLLQTLEESPIAIGRGNFLVDETFALKFVGAVVTFFLFFMESDKDNEERRRR